MEVANKIAGTPTGSGGPFPSDVPEKTVVIDEIKLVTEGPATGATLPGK
jgi:peptidyl-prolyl cis-trans isomerase A (cyclophilin A)/peptidyl-prolyl cis-trans isomerase B (cyclophilin B)